MGTPVWSCREIAHIAFELDPLLSCLCNILLYVRSLERPFCRLRTHQLPPVKFALSSGVIFLGVVIVWF